MNSLLTSKLCIIAIISASILAPFTIANESGSTARDRRFISFDSEGGKIDIDLDLSIPFLSIPLDNDVSQDGGRGPLLNVNTKAITVAGLLAAMAAFVVPLFFKTQPGHRYRLDDNFEFSQMGNTMNEFVFGNNYVTPCIQRTVCTLVAKGTRTNNPTSTDKIIDGITSNAWFGEITNGTAIQEAISKGRDKNRDCSFIYNECSMPGKIFDNLLNQFGNF